MTRAYDSELWEWEEESALETGAWSEGGFDSIEARLQTVPIRRRRSPAIEVTHPGIPGADNRWFPSQGQARQAALILASQLGFGYRIEHDRYPALGPPHYHVVAPTGLRVSGHFFYGGRPPRQVFRGRPWREAEQAWEMPAGRLTPILPPVFHNLPQGLVPVPHMHVRRICSTDASSLTSDSGPRVMLPTNMNPGFITADDQIQFDKKLDDALIKLMVEDREYRTFLAPESIRNRSPSAGDKIRIALVDLTGRKLCSPGYAGWGSTTQMRSASTAKIGIVFAVHQLLFDLREMVRVNNIQSTADLLRKAKDTWAALKCQPDLTWLFNFDQTTSPLKVEKSQNLVNHLSKVVDATFSGISTSLASQLIMRVGFEYIASVLWQSGLRHPTRQGLWFGSTFCPVPASAPTDPSCHSKGCPVVWAKDPFAIKRIYLNALSVATFFTLLAQQRLVNEQFSRDIETLLSRGCSWLFADLSGIARVRAAKCGIVSITSGAGQLGNFRHDAGLIENDSRRYVLVYLTRNLPMSDRLRTRFVRDLDRLIQNNNQP